MIKYSEFKHITGWRAPALSHCVSYEFTSVHLLLATWPILFIRGDHCFKDQPIRELQRLLPCGWWSSTSINSELLINSVSLTPEVTKVCAVWTRLRSNSSSVGIRDDAADQTENSRWRQMFSKIWSHKQRAKVMMSSTETISAGDVHHGAVRHVTKALANESSAGRMDQHSVSDSPQWDVMLPQQRHTQKNIMTSLIFIYTADCRHSTDRFYRFQAKQSIRDQAILWSKKCWISLSFDNLMK